MADQSHKLGTVFVSYSHRDKRWLDRLRVHVKPLEREAFFAVWDDTRISAGQNWRPEIQKAIEAASAAVLLVSTHFLGSDFITETELPLLLEAKGRGLTILPLILSPCRYEQTKSLGELQALNSPSRTLMDMTEPEQERIFVDLANQIHASLMRPVTELREKLQQKFSEIDREIDREFELHRKINWDPTLANDEAARMLGFGFTHEMEHLYRKLHIVMKEIAELDDKQAEQAVRRDKAYRKGVILQPLKWLDLQREFLEEELQKLNWQLDQKGKERNATHLEFRRELPHIFKDPK